MKFSIMPLALAALAGVLAACSPKKDEQPAPRTTAAEEISSSGGMQAWGEATTAVDTGLSAPEQTPTAPNPSPAWNPGSMQPSDPSAVPQMWGADGSQAGQQLMPEDVPVMQGADDPMPGQPNVASSPVPVLQSPVDLMKGEPGGTPVPVLQSPADLNSINPGQ